MPMTISQRTSLVTAQVADRLGADRVETDPAALVKLSSDWSRMSPGGNEPFIQAVRQRLRAAELPAEARHRGPRGDAGPAR